MRLVDGFVADILASGKVVQESLGARANLGDALDALLDLAAGGLDTGRAGTEPLTVALNTAFGTHRLTDSRAVLVERVRRAVAGPQRLTKESDGAPAEASAPVSENSNSKPTNSSDTLTATPRAGRLAGVSVEPTKAVRSAAASRATRMKSSASDRGRVRRMATAHCTPRRREAV